MNEQKKIEAYITRTSKILYMRARMSAKYRRFLMRYPTRSWKLLQLKKRNITIYDRNRISKQIA